MKKMPGHSLLFLLGFILTIISCSKTGNEDQGQELNGKWAVHSIDYNSKGYGGTYHTQEQFSGNKALYQFSPNGQLTYLPEKAKATYQLNLQDSVLEIQPDSCLFLNLCYHYYQTDPNLYPIPGRGNQTPGTLRFTYIGQDSFEVVAKYVQSPGYYSDSFVVVHTGFHRE